MCNNVARFAKLRKRRPHKNFQGTKWAFFGKRSRRCGMNRLGICGVKTFGLILDTWKGCWWIWTVGRWPWKSASAKECVTTHQPNPPAPKMDDASAQSVTYPLFLWYGQKQTKRESAARPM